MAYCELMLLENNDAGIYFLYAEPEFVPDQGQIPGREIKRPSNTYFSKKFKCISSSRHWSTAAFHILVNIALESMYNNQ